MTGDRIDFLILGSGPAGARASEAIRRKDRQARVVAVSADPHPFYNRILLSKDFLKRDDLAPAQVTIKPAELWEKQGIELRSGERVVGLDAAAREARLETGEILPYERCLVATGASPLVLPVPGSGAPGVHTLRSLNDARRLREAARETGRAVVVGGGLIGVEIAAALAQRGLRCTVIEREPWIFGRVAPEPVGLALRRFLEEGGVEVVTGATVTGFRRGGDGLWVGTRPTAGAARPTAGEERSYPGDLAIMGVGVRPETGFLENVERTADGGIVVDERLQAAPGLWAAGDVAAYPDPHAGLRHRVEHWLHAQHQGRVAGANMVGDDQTYAEITSYDTELFGTTIQVFGTPALAEEWSVEGLGGAGAGVAWGSRHGRVVTVYRMGDVDVRRAEIKLRMMLR
ncbi:MAG: NAD(P)/FAD-dependent oxidoreductase [Gemmatimonadota bacterium]